MFGIVESLVLNIDSAAQCFNVSYDTEMQVRIV